MGERPRDPADDPLAEDADGCDLAFEAAGPELGPLTQGIAYARCPADTATRLRRAAEVAATAARRPDFVAPAGALAWLAQHLDGLAEEIGGRR